SVITTASGSLASTASTTADLVNFAGTKMTVTSAPVASTASATELKTGTLTPPSNSTDCPPLPGVTPPTMLVPEVSIRWVCFLPSEPVMPWTMTLESAVRKIAMSGGRLSVSVGGGRSQLGGAPRGAVHGFLDGDEGVGVVGQDLAALLDVVAVQPHDERLGRLVTQRLERADNAVGHRVTGGDAPEDVDEHRLDLLVAQDDVQSVRHHLGGRATTDVQEVGGLRRAGELLAGVGHDVEG